LSEARTGWRQKLLSIPTLQGIALGIAFGAAIGIGGFTFIYAKGYSYLTNDPGACANCHVMQEQYSGWLKSSHRSVAVCNDCHTPPGFVGKYYTKASNGFWHSYYFTTNTFHEPIRITERNRQVAEEACRKCHAEVTSGIDAHMGGGEAGGEGALSCIRCHRNVGHMH
jgi:cytochrome c nitrite reductase small subunit